MSGFQSTFRGPSVHTVRVDSGPSGMSPLFQMPTFAGSASTDTNTPDALWVRLKAAEKAAELTRRDPWHEALNG